jgi:Ran GTPase-activating protein (RanGAP) involved in mRNA processing and transport
VTDISCLAELEGLTSVTLSYCPQIKMQGVMRACQAMTGLAHLDVSNCALYGNDWKHMAKMINTNEGLVSLNLASNNIGIDPGGAMALAAAIRGNTTLSQLNINTNDLRSEGAKALAEALEKNGTLGTLDISGNSLGKNVAWNNDTIGLVMLATSLKKNSGLSRITLSKNTIRGAVVGTALGNALAVNTQLKALDLSGNCLDAAFSRELGIGLMRNEGLMELDLRQNPISAKQKASAKAICEAKEIDLLL